MKIAIHQPNFLPWSGYFAKIAGADTFVFLDDVQYEKQGFTNRNRIRHANGWLWLTVPLQNKVLDSSTAISDVRIAWDNRWPARHLRQIDAMYVNSPCLGTVRAIVAQEYRTKYEYLAQLNIGFIKALCAYLGLISKLVRSSELNVSGTSTARLVNICQALGADTYLSGRGGRKYQDETLFTQNGIRLEYIDYECTPYPQGSYPDFIPNLSIIDMILNLGPEETARRLVESGTT